MGSFFYFETFLLTSLANNEIILNSSNMNQYKMDYRLYLDNPTENLQEIISDIQEIRIKLSVALGATDYIQFANYLADFYLKFQVTNPYIPLDLLEQQYRREVQFKK